MTRYGIILCGCLLFGTSAGFSYDWSTNPGNGSPENPYQISEPNQLIAIGSNTDLLDKCFILMNDIIFDPNNNPNHVFTAAVIAPDTDTAGGYQGTPFTGCFDGDGYQIANLSMANNNYLGLFGKIGSGGQVRNLELKNVVIHNGGSYLGGLAGYTDQCTIKDCRLTVNITGRDYLGGMIGYNTGSTISTCNTAGTIECIGSGFSSAGGLIGYNWEGLIDRCFAVVDLEGEGICSGGGLIGKNMESTIQYCSAAGSITGGVDLPIVSGIGGLVGRNFGSTICFCSAFGDVTDLRAFGNLGGLVGFSSETYNSTIRFSSASGHVTAGPYSTYIGGLVGQNYGQIEFCSASGSVTGGKYVGGLIGYSGPELRISQCYAEGDVKGTDRVGGLLGTNYPLPSRACCYTAGGVSAGYQAKFVGGLAGQFRPFSSVSPRYRCYFLAQEDLIDYYGLPLTDVQMKQQASFIEWDFAGETANGTEDIWRMCEDGTSYPKHAWEYGMYGDFACPEGVGSEDLAALMAAWGTHKGDPGFSYACDGSGDGLIDLEDFAILSRHWLAPILSVSQDRVDFFVPYSNPSVHTQTLTIQNTGRSTLDWDLELPADLPEWLSIHPQNGILEPGESQSVTLEADITGLPIGYYNYICRIMENSAQNSPQVLIVKLYVSPFAGGSGTPEDPFRIRTPRQLIAIGEDPFLLDKCYKLIRDIDLSGFVFQDAVIAAMEGKSMGSYEGTPFSGLFDGNGYRIINLTINTGNEEADYLGLFGYIDMNGQVRNLGLENVLIDSRGSYIGALAGFNAGIRIDSCFATGIINGVIVGGLVGRNRTEILNCYTNISITGTGLGGLVGVNYSSEYYLDEYYSRNGTIRNSYTAGNLSGDHSRRVLAGYYEYDHAYELLCDLVTSCYFLDTMGSDTLPYTYPLTDAQMKQQASFVGWDFMGETADGTGDIWWIEEGVDYPRLWWELNEPPAADAGTDQIAYAEIDGFSQVQLDGTASYDPDEEELDYYWYTDANDLIATGLHPVIILPIGEHIITLVVNDGHVDSEPNDVLITVIGPLESSLTFVPNIINPRSRGDYIMAILTLPKEVSISDLDGQESWRLLPGDLEALFTWEISNRRWQTVFAVFDRQALLDVLDLPDPRGRSHRFYFRRHPSSTKIELTVYSKLITGQTIFGTKTIQIVSPPGTKTK